MRRLSHLVLLCAAAACADSQNGLTEPEVAEPGLKTATAPTELPAFQPGIVVARFTDPREATQIAAERGAKPIRQLRIGAHVLSVAQGQEEALVRALSNHPKVTYAELSVPRILGLPCSVGDGDCQVPTDGLFGLRWDLHNDGTVRDGAGNVLESVGLVPDADMDWLEAFDQLGPFSGSAVVGVLDTGIFGDHPDLLGRLVAQHDHFNVDDVAEDDNGHGTHVSGIVLARGDNGLGASGIAYGPNIQLVVSKVCGVTIVGYICWSPDIADGIVWAVDNGANVLNLSLGGDQGSEAEQEALQYALANDVLPVCAAGNDQSDVDFPGAFPECMAVSSTDWADQLSSFSSRGPEVEVSAPGGDTIHALAYDRIASTWNDGGYVYAAGTSMASPQVAGLAALLHALGVTSAADKRAIIRSTAEDLGPAGPDSMYGDGRVNVWNAVLAALGSPPPPPPPNDPPTAGFTSGCTDNACDFTDTSTDPDGSIVSWSWDFGDGQGSTAQSPTHAYTAAGTYTVTLTVTDNRGASDSAQQAVTVSDPPPNDPPTAGFTSGCTDNACDFTDTSTDSDGSIASWSWDFGDGQGSTAQSPSHAYAAAGTYTVTLTVTDNRGASDSAQQAVTVTDPPPPPPNQPPVASFTYSCTDLQCDFTDTSTDPENAVTSWIWDFGDGTMTNAPSPAHTYAADGTYTVTLTVTDDGGLSDSDQNAVTVNAPPSQPNEQPTASFTYSCSDLQCDFTDTSTDLDGSVVSWSWSFGDGTMTNAPSPTHVYATAGTYTVTLTVTDDGGLTDSTPQAVTVTDPAPPPPNDPPTAGFTYSCTDLQCDFTDASTDPDGIIASWSWTFGDGTSTTAPSPTHVYAAGGTYTVTLTVTDDGGLTDSSQQTVSVADPPPPPPNEPPSASFTYSCAGLQCDFTDTSTDPDGSIASWSWTFGDGTSTTAPSPTHVYANGGTYTVTLTVTDDGGLTDSAQQSLTIAEAPNEPPAASFTYACTYLQCDFTDTSTDPDGSIASWSWDFGDASTTTAPDPTHVYAAGGTYTVTLTVTDDGGLTDSSQQTLTVTDPPPPPPNEAPTASFTYDCTDLRCDFTDTSTDPDGSIASRSWNFGDASTTTAPNPTHFYAAGGTYTVTLTVTDDGGLTDSSQQTVTVTDPPPPPPNEAPTASFTHSCADLTCDFTDASTDPDGSIASWSWTFGDGTSTTAPSPTHVYGVGGTYTVTLTVTDDGGLTDAVQQTVTVVDPPPPPPNQAPTASFTVSCTDLGCDFTDTSGDPDGSIASRSWSFGDGTSTTAPNPTHFYAVGGSYTVTLTVTDDRGSTDSVQQTVTTVAGLAAIGFKEQGRHVIDLTWSTSAASVDVYRDGIVVATVTGGLASYQDRPGGRGQATYTYMVCETGTTACSSQVPVVF